jgi:type VI protein secretion system component VasK
LDFKTGSISMQPFFMPLKQINFKLLTIALVLIALALTGIFWQAAVKRKQNKKLAAQVAENKLLLQEVHQRVKNNLQILSSFILLQQIKKNVDSEELIRQL